MIRTVQKRAVDVRYANCHRDSRSHALRDDAEVLKQREDAIRRSGDASALAATPNERLTATVAMRIRFCALRTGFTLAFACRSAGSFLNLHIAKRRPRGEAVGHDSAGNCSGFGP